MKEETCCFTGHRRVPTQVREVLYDELLTVIEILILRGIDTFVAGGAYGFDIMAERAVLQMRKKYDFVRLLLYLPCENQCRNWREADIKAYDEILSACDEYRYISREYNSHCMQDRNCAMVDVSSVCVCYMTQPRGGTANTISYAKKVGCEIVYMTDRIN